MTRRLVAIAAAAFLLAACGTREIAALNREADRLRLERDTLANLAERLDDLREEDARLTDGLARTVESGILLEHDKRIERAKTVAGVTLKSLGAGSGWEISGADAEALRLLRKDAGALAVERIDVTASGWTMKSPAYDYSGVPGSVTPGIHIPPPTPLPGRFSGAPARRLRAEIEALQREVAELEQLVRPVVDLDTKRKNLAARVALLETPSRLAATGSIASHLFLEEDAICRTGSLTVSQSSVRLFCAPRAKDADAGADALRALFTTGTDKRWRLGAISIDERAPEPLQASLTHQTVPLR